MLLAPFGPGGAAALSCRFMPGETPRCGLQHEGLLETTRAQFKEPAIVLQLRPAATLSGRVVDHAARPVAGARVEFVAEAVSGAAAVAARNPGRTTSDAGGAFRIEGVAAGHGRLRIAAEGYAPFERAAIDVRPPEQVLLGDLHLDSGVAQAVWVTKPGGRPVAGATVITRGRYGRPAASCATNSRGSCRLSPLVAGEVVELAVRSETGEVVVEEVLPGVEPLLVTMLPRRAIAGRVIDGAGRDLAGARVTGRVEGTARQGERLLRSSVVTAAISGSTGGFVLEGLPAGRLELTTELEGYLPLSRTEALSPDALLILQLESGATLAGRVLGPDGEPVAGVWVTVDSTAGGCSAPSSALSDDADALGSPVYRPAAPTSSVATPI